MSMGPAGSAWLIANRQRTLDDTATTSWKTIMADYTKEGTKPALSTVNDIVTAARATHNADLLDTISHDAERMDLSGEFGAHMSLAGQHAQITAMAAAAGRGNLSPGNRCADEGSAAQVHRDRRQVSPTTPIATTAATNFSTDKIKYPSAAGLFHMTSPPLPD